MPNDRSTGGERGPAVCFTAGIDGVPFALGLIHAYLVSGQPPPSIVAGISSGALSAAALQRCYLEIDKAASAGATQEQIEEARWRWFRRYLAFIVDSPFDFLWKAIPDVSDVVARRPPIRETALPATDPEGWSCEEKEHRLDYHLFTKLFSWLFFLRLSVRDIALLGASRVRAKEVYRDAWSPLWWRKTAYCWRGVLTFFCILQSVVAHPHFVRVRYLQADNKDRLPFRPLFGWSAWLVSVGVSAILPILLLLLFTGHVWWSLALIVALCAILWWALLEPAGGDTATKKSPAIRLLAGALANTHLHDSLLNAFYLKLKLSQLFQDDEGEALVTHEPMQTLLVACPLDTLQPAPGTRGREGVHVQFWPTTENGGRETVANAIAACLAVPGLFPPAKLKVSGASRLAAWINPRLSSVNGTELHLVDASVIRRNPLPALFDALKQYARAHDGDRFEPFRRLLSDRPGDYRIHLVYNRPVARKTPPPAKDLSVDGELASLPNSVDAGLLGLRLAARRDSRQEVWQTNYQTEFVLAVEEVAGTTIAGHGKRPKTLQMLVDEISPETEFAPRNHLAPQESELLRYAAEGCRQALCAIYRQDLAERAHPATCPEFLAAKGIRIRRADPGSNRVLPGLAEICQHCTQALALGPDDRRVAAGERHSIRIAGSLLPAKFREDPERAMGNVPTDRPRITFLASGGVFRGAFHIGVIAALRTMNIRPDLIVGASVGTLIGAVLGEITVRDDKTAFQEILPSLVTLFLEVDDRVALTKRLKGAVRDLAVRGKSIRLRPLDIRRAVLSGSKKDAGFAATGAPPELIDAISWLFVIPHQQTAEIAAKFVAEDVLNAVNDFLARFREQTIRRLGINHAVLGAELLEVRFRELLQQMGPRLRSAQPFLNELPDHDLAFFATTVNLTEEWMSILGCDVERQEQSYDFVEAALSSSALPCAFAPRRESQIYPGLGRRDVFYGDGGMFDNLPFLPATLLLGALQQHRLRSADHKAKWADLRRRLQQPDLFLVGALDVSPQKVDGPIPLDSIRAILRRAGELDKNEKIRSFERMSARMDRDLRHSILDLPDPSGTACLEDWEIINGYVHAGVLPIYPSSKGHLNGTFAFSRTVGFDPARVSRSIADGCFRTLERLTATEATPWGLGQRALRNLQTQESPRIQRVSKTLDPERGSAGKCPFFVIATDGHTGDGLPITCPFTHTSQPEVSQLYDICWEDKKPNR
jgi:predicted acylesterase/phospholipase RssA